MTPAINLLKRHAVTHRVHRYQHDTDTLAYGREAADKLALDPARVFKTLVVMLDRTELVVALVPVSGMLDLKLLARAAGSRRAAMAERADAERGTGYLLGGISPLGQKRRLRTFIDASARQHETMYISAGRRGLELELTPLDLVKLCHGEVFRLSSD
jgi:Cys-tRNA(Pro)/Cys-tRNA(Cys) deacylase